MRVLLISPYHGGSHQAWAEGLARHSTHKIDLLTLPARFWKWRMHGGAVTLARRFLEQGRKPDLILATDMLDLTTFMALTRKQTGAVPAALYMHENQLTYPLPEDGRIGPMRRQLGERDRHYAFVNYASMLAAEGVLFNSAYHMQSFFEALLSFLKHFPEYKELGSISMLREKSQVVPVGIDLRRLDRSGERGRQAEETAAPLILWNQRWEYDKNPEGFFDALTQLAEEGIEFRLALCGQQYGKQPESFADGQASLGKQIVHSGYANPEQYKQLLWEADITVSTAWHEFFGISIVEAIYAQTFPILPARLSYPELIPHGYREACLYEDPEALVARLRWALADVTAVRKIAVELATGVASYDWHVQAPQYDRVIESLAA